MLDILPRKCDHCQTPLRYVLTVIDNPIFFIVMDSPYRATSIAFSMDLLTVRYRRVRS